MVATLQHSAADICSRLLIALGAGSDPTIVDPITGLPTGTWPIYAAGEPPAPDEVIVVSDTASLYDARVMTDGSVERHYGIQVKLRTSLPQEGEAKTRVVEDLMNSGFYAYHITIDGYNYIIHSFSGVRVIARGKQVPSSKLSIFTISALVKLYICP